MRARNRPENTAEARTGLRPAGTRARRMGLALALAAFLLPQGAGAELVGKVDQRAAVAGRSDAALIEANPLLRRLRGVQPALLRKALERLRRSAGAPKRSLERPKLPPEEESGILAENPDLNALYRESPEAALDLIRLIREASKKK